MFTLVTFICNSIEYIQLYFISVDSCESRNEVFAKKSQLLLKN